MRTDHHGFGRRIDSLRSRVDALTSLRQLVALPADRDLTPRQWSLIEGALSAAKQRLSMRVTRAARVHLPEVPNRAHTQKLNAALGEIEIELSSAFTFFDTYMDVLTQRQTPALGQMLAGCDVLARDALARNHPALAIIERPLVYCDRGFGASVMREGVRLPDATLNPMPLIEIPYSRLKEKHNLTSILHESGHEAMVRLGLRKALPSAIRVSLEAAGVPTEIAALYAGWISEIGPDFWAFCASGVAEAAAVREILALAPSLSLRIAWNDPHPPPYLRALLAFDWCRRAWGRGVWDDWEQAWLEVYPLDALPVGHRSHLEAARAAIPRVSHALFTTRFRTLQRQTIVDLFDLDALSPTRLAVTLRGASTTSPAFTALSPCVQLCAFRLLRERGEHDEPSLDRAMTDWLVGLPRPRTAPN